MKNRNMQLDQEHLLLHEEIEKKLRAKVCLVVEDEKNT